MRTKACKRWVWRRLAVGALWLTAVLGVAGRADAQENRATQAADSDEIIVTAAKSPQRLSDAPFSVLVLTSDALDRARIQDFEDLTTIAPSLTITRTSQPANTSIAIRGIGTYAFTIAAEPSVAVIIDGVSQSSQAAALTSLIDVAQVEVLRGPQNSLFGEAASAGVVIITTAPVSDTLTGRLDVLRTDDGEERIEAMLSGPLSDDLGFRIAGGFSEYRGGLYNLATRNWVNGQIDVNIRARLEWRPDAHTVFAITPHWTRTDGTCCTAAETFLPVGASTGGAATGPDRIAPEVFLEGITPAPDNRFVRMDVDPRGDAEDAGAALHFEREGPGFVFTSITSFNEYRLEDLQDTDSTAIDFSLYQSVSPSGGSANGGRFDITSATQELRINSAGSGPWQFVAGLYASETRSRRYFVRGSNALDDYNTTTPVGQPGAPPVPASLPTTNGTTYSRYLAHAEAVNYAIFGQVDYAVSDRLDLFAGLRINQEETSYRFDDLVNGVVFGSPRCSSASPSGTPISTCSDETAVTGRVGARYRPSPDLMVFGHYSRGGKGVAYDLTSILTTRTPTSATSAYPGRPLADVVASMQPVPAESIDNFEIGFRGAFWNDALSLSVTAFHMDIENLQAQSRDLLLAQNILNSVGRVTSEGVEAELTLQLDRLTVQAAGAYVRAIIDEFPNASCYRGQSPAEGCVGGVQDLSGRTLFNAPEWNFAVNAQYDHPVGAGATVFLTVGYRWQSDVMFSLLQDPASRQSSFGIADLALGVRTDRWRATAFVHNAFDTSHSLNAGRSAHINNPPGAFATNWRPARDADRYWGMRLTYQF